MEVVVSSEWKESLPSHPHNSVTRIYVYLPRQLSLYEDATLSLWAYAKVLFGMLQLTILGGHNLSATSVWYKPYCSLKRIHSQLAPVILTIFPLSLLCFIPSLMSSSNIRDSWEESFQWEVLQGWEVGWKRSWAWVRRGSRILRPLLLVPPFLFLFSVLFLSFVDNSFSFILLDCRHVSFDMFPSFFSFPSVVSLAIVFLDFNIAFSFV
jgi:hypothetical protein